MPPLIESQSDRMVVRAAGDPELKLLMFHHAGGSAAAMLQLTRQLPGTVEATAFELAGRGVRMSEPAARTFTGARDELLEKFRDSLDRPTVIFGHSLGAMLADSMLRKLEGQQRAMIRRVIFSAYPYAVGLPPGTPPRSADSLRRQLAESGGTPAVVFDTPELLDYFVTTLGNDMRLVDTSDDEPRPDPAALDYEIWLGKADNTPGVLAPDRWREIFPGPPVIRQFDGGHFYLFGESVDLVSQALREVTESQLLSTRSGNVQP